MCLFNQGGLELILAGGLFVAALGFGEDSSQSKVPPIPKVGPLAQPKSPHQIGFPAALTRADIPSDNPQADEKIALGEKLFFDGRLSADGTVACSTCHDPARAFTDGRPTSVGIKGRVGQRNAPTVLNALYNKTQFWDGRAKSLEDQAALPITNPFEMGQPSLEAAVAKIATIPEPEGVYGRLRQGAEWTRSIDAWCRARISMVVTARVVRANRTSHISASSDLSAAFRIVGVAPTYQTL